MSLFLKCKWIIGAIAAVAVTVGSTYLYLKPTSPTEGTLSETARTTSLDFEGMPRTVIALYDSQQFPKPRFTSIHNFAEMPLNHLGLIVEYHDIRAGLPNLDQRQDIRGILTWFRNEEPFTNPGSYLKWATSQIEQGRKFVVMGLPGFRSAIQQTRTTVSEINKLYKLLGLEYIPNQWKNASKDLQFTAVRPDGVGFERPLEDVNVGYHTMRAADSSLTPYIQATNEESHAPSAILASTHPNGGVVEAGFNIYSHYDTARERDTRKWIINPFVFFADAFGTDELPKPDTTTLFGKRIFYSHIDGDGWNGISGYCKLDNHHDSCAEAIKKDLLEAFPDIPVTVAPIAGDLDPEYGGSTKSQAMARAIFSLPHIEPASHTYTHPMKWSALVDDGDYVNEAIAETYEKQGYDELRLYNEHPFSLDQEIRAAVEYIQQFAPKSKKIMLLQWSGDTFPSKTALEMATASGLLNINGGDTRMDSIFSSYAWVRPIGRTAGGYRQIYASNSNENTYTNQWQGDRGGLRKLKETWDNTESPIRIKPMNLYYHIFSAQYLKGMEAIKSLLHYARTQSMIAIHTSNYVHIANGFFSAQIVPLGDQSWRVQNRGALQTIRFDNKAIMHVDMAASKGVLGYQHSPKSLYVHLDADIETPIITLTNQANNTPYLIQSNWQISAMQTDSNDISFTVQGYGTGNLQWQMIQAGNYTITLKNEYNEEIWSSTPATDESGILSIIAPINANSSLTMMIEQSM